MTTARNMASSTAAAEQSWSWWMNNASAIRVPQVRGVSDAEDELAGPNEKIPRLDDDDDDDNDGGGYWNDSTSTTIACPLDLSMKATVAAAVATTAAAAAQRVQQHGRRSAESGCGGNAYATTTPVKKKSAAGGKSSSKKTAGKTTAAACTTGIRPSAIKAVTRKLLPQLMLDRTSPVSGTIITTIASSNAETADDYDGDDIDPEYNIVVATDDARRRLESIPNVLGPYRCRLCGVRYADAFALARHRCRCIVHVRYRCPECDKVFQCPANLASHRRWHGTATSVKTTACSNNNNNNNNDNDDNDNDNDNDDINDDNDDDDEPIIARDDSTAVTVSCTGSVVTTAAGFKKNILQRAVRAAAAAAARMHDENSAST